MTCAATLGLADQQSVPVHQEPMHHLVLENEDVYILDVRIPVGETTLYHTHADPIFYVSISSSRTRSQRLGRDWVGPGTGPVRAPGGAMNNTRYADRPVTHRVENVGDDLFRLIAVINRGHHAATHTAGGGETPTLPPGLEKEIDNHWFRSFRVTLAPGESHGPHRHNHVTVVIEVDDGDWTFHEAGAEHTLTNHGSEPLELVEVEIR